MADMGDDAPAMRFKIRTLNNISLAGLRRLPRANYEVSSDIQHPDAILVRSASMHEMAIPDSVLAVARAGAGTNNIPVDACSRRGIPVFNAPGANANAVKELVLAGLLVCARNMTAAWDYTRGLTGSDAEIGKAVEAAKKQFVGFELPRRTLGVIGLGSIGVEVANAALALGMRVIGYDPNITVSKAWQLSSGVQKAANLDDLFSRADVLTLHVPLGDDTRDLVNEDRLRLVPAGTVLLNFARAGVVDDAAVIAALDAGRLAGYVSDFPSQQLLRHPQVICLPHLGASTQEAEENCAVMVADTLREYLEHGNVRNSVNFPETVLPRTRPHRVAIPHRNVPNMVAQILTSVAQEDINIADLLNQSRGELSHTIVDLDGAPSGECLARIRAIDGILCVRVLPVDAQGATAFRS
jgi:D-3-phosphoglycerate dehydrogenase / 2-oxoglutarate reductase